MYRFGRSSAQEQLQGAFVDARGDSACLARAVCPRHTALRPHKVPSEVARALARAHKPPGAKEPSAAARLRRLCGRARPEAAARADRGRRAPSARATRLAGIIGPPSRCCGCKWAQPSRPARYGRRRRRACDRLGPAAGPPQDPAEADARRAPAPRGSQAALGPCRGGASTGARAGSQVFVRATQYGQSPRLAGGKTPSGEEMATSLARARAPPHCAAYAGEGCTRSRLGDVAGARSMQQTAPVCLAESPSFVVLYHG